MTGNFVTHLECSLTGETVPAGAIHGLSRAGRPLLVRYDLARLERAVSKSALAARTGGFWRYREFLPLQDSANAIDLGEVVTPIFRLPKLENGVGELWVKDEGRLPTGSFKARGLGVAVSMANELGIRITSLCQRTATRARRWPPTPAARGMESFIFCPADTPDVNVREIATARRTTSGWSTV